MRKIEGSKKEQMRKIEGLAKKGTKQPRNRLIWNVTSEMARYCFHRFNNFPG